MSLLEDVEVRIRFCGVPCIAYVNVNGDEVDEVTCLVPCDDKWNEGSSDLLPTLNREALYKLDDLILTGLELMKLKATI